MSYLKGAGLGGGDCPSPVTVSSISAIFRLNDSFSSAEIFWYAISTSLFFCASKRPYAVGRSLTEASRALLASPTLEADGGPE